MSAGAIARDLLAKLLLRWGSLTKQQKRELVKLVETEPGK